jgi:transcription antitermination factor NusG
MKPIPKWYAVYTRSRAEKKVAEAFEEQHIEHYLPLITTLRQWSDRKKKVRLPLITGYVFVHITRKQHMQVLETFGVVKILHFKGLPVAIPDYQINNLKILLGTMLPVICDPIDYIKGQDVQIVHGPLKGVRGKILLIKGCQKLVITINALKCNLLVDIDPHYVEPDNPGKS